MIGGRVTKEMRQMASNLIIVAKYGVDYDDCDVEARANPIGACEYDWFVADPSLEGCWKWLHS
jgi:hypothetical protein